MGLFEEGGDTVVTYFKRGTIANDLGAEQGGSSLFYGAAGAGPGSFPLKTRRIVPVGVMMTGSLKMDCGLMF